jgi:hypothetical protein
MPSTGSNKLEDLWRSRGTHRLTPYGGVTDKGGVVTATATGGVVTLSHTAAAILLDALPFSVPAGTIATPVLPNGLNLIKLFIKPVRKTLAVTSLPATGVIDRTVMLVNPADVEGNYQYLNDIYIYTATGWQVRDKFVKANLDPNKPYVPENYLVGRSADFRNLPFNEIVGASASLQDEPDILYPANVGLPLTSPGMGPSFARFSSGFLLAEVAVLLTAGAIATPATDLKIVRPTHVDLI